MIRAEYGGEAGGRVWVGERWQGIWDWKCVSA